MSGLSARAPIVDPATVPKAVPSRQARVAQREDGVDFTQTHVEKQIFGRGTLATAACPAAMRDR